MVRIHVFSFNPKFEPQTRILKRFGKRLLNYLKKDNIQLETYLVGDKEMRFLNRKFRSKNKAADVLSFATGPKFIYSPSHLKRLGEIYLNLSYTQKKDKNGEKLLMPKLFIHGLLHLLGYTHGRERDRIKMENIENNLIKFYG